MSLWRAADGRVLEIKDMTDLHLGNALRMLKRQESWKKELETDHPPSISFKEMKKEAEKRGVVWDFRNVITPEGLGDPYTNEELEAIEKYMRPEEAIPYLTQHYLAVMNMSVTRLRSVGMHRA